MPVNRAVWGIDIGQAGLKAVRLRYADAAEQAIAVAFDYVPHPKILSQPDAVPEELIPQALEKFLSRNEVAGDAVAISVPGHTALARFIQLPPVESSKVAEIVKYEARQQIPFALEDVIWDYQTLGGGTEESGYMLEAEVGLFAMKRDQVMQHMQPFVGANVELELIQIAPLALYNVLSYDFLGVRSGQELESPDEYTIILDMGADNTTLMVSNGEKIWIRNVPIGGNHFTRALTKEMKLTFAKAEHLKCNATKSPDPRAVFQALRPVFNDYVSEIQRSIGYFSSVNRDAKIAKVLGVGNGFKLAGLQKFLQQNLQYDVERYDRFRALVGDAVLNAPLFQDNILSFTVPYGLALQALELTRIRTTLLPPEIARARMIRRKKPWAVAAAASLLFGFSLSAGGWANVDRSVAVDRWEDAIKDVKDLSGQVSTYKSKYSAEKSTFEATRQKGGTLIRNLDEREYWPEVYKAINECLPRDPVDVEIEDITKQNRIKLTSIVAEHKTEVGEWFAGLAGIYKQKMTEYDRENAPAGPGYVFTISGVHFHEEDDARMNAISYVQNTLLKNLREWTVQHPDSSPVAVGQIGISHATITSVPRLDKIDYYPNGQPPSATPSQLRGGFGNQPRPGFGGGIPRQPGRGTPARREKLAGELEENQVKVVKIPMQKFAIQFVWQPLPRGERTEQPPYADAEGEAAQGEPPAEDNAAQPPAT